MEFSRNNVMTWASSDILEEGSKLFTAGAVHGTQVKGNILAGSVTMGASRLIVRLTMGTGAERPHVDCNCATAQKGGVCRHAIAVALHYLQAHGEVSTAETLTFAAERAPTRAEIIKWCGPTLFARAEALVKSGAVNRISFQYPEGEGEVICHGSAMHVKFRMTANGFVEGECPCFLSHNTGLLCEHAMAVALGVMHHYGNAERRAMYAHERATMAQINSAKGLIVRSAQGTPALLRIFLPTTLGEQFDQGAIRIVLRIFVESRVYSPETLPQGRYQFSESDENVLCILEDIAGGAFGETLTLAPADLLSLLRCGVQSWLGFATDKVRLKCLLAPVETPLSLVPKIEQECVELSVLRPAEGRLLICGRVGWWWGCGCARPLAHVLPVPFQSLYRETERLPRKSIISFFKTELPLLTAVLPMGDNELTPDLFTTTAGTPRFRLTLRGSPASVSAVLRAQYGAEWVTANVPSDIAVPDPDDFYHCFVRNPDAEEAALHRVREMGFMGSNGKDLQPITGARAVLNLLGKYVTTARRAGWRVDLEGPLAEFFDRAEVIVPVIRIQEQGAEFELRTEFVSPRQVLQVTPVEVERAMACGNAYIEKDGQTALLDIGAIGSLREMVNSCSARAGTAPGSSCISAMHAPFVQAALTAMEGIDFESSPDWQGRASRQNRLMRPETIPLGALENTLRPYQKEGVYWLRFLEESGFCGILADEMGLGKTLQTLTWLQLSRVREEARRVPALIICPTSLVENWNREAEKFVPWLRRLVVAGPDRAALFAKVPEADVVITSYALIRRDIDFYEQCRFSVIVLDEAQAIKNQHTQNALSVKRLVADTKVVLSGTPIENGVADLWSIMDFLMPKYLGSYEDFKIRYEERIALGGADAEEAQSRLREKLHPFLLRRVKKEVAKDLPDKIRSITYCKLTSDQRRVYDELRSAMLEKMRGLVKAKGFEKSKFEMLALLMRLRQVCCDLRLLKTRVARPNEESSAKLDALMELLAEAHAEHHRLLIFSQFTTMLHLIAERLEAEGLTYCYLDGATKDRLGQCSLFNQTPSIPVFLISLKAGGTGLNLTGADMVVHFDPWWNPSAEEQATDRAHRIGQKKTVHAIKLIAEDTVEEKVLEMQQRKQALIEATVNASDASIAQTLTWTEIEGLLS
ncbi:MAG: DEAD/DEAH box helicase [Kiritimatiellia bacterium]